VLPKKIRLIDSKNFVKVDIDEMLLEGDTGRRTLRLREKSRYLTEKAALAYWCVILSALNGKRKVATVIRWVDEFTRFTTFWAESNSSKIEMISLGMLNNYSQEKNASQIKLLRSLIKFWLSCKKPGISECLSDYISTSKSPKPRGTLEIQNSDKKERPFSMAITRTILARLNNLYIDSDLDAQDHLLWRLIISEAMRPTQLRLLVVGDITDLEKRKIDIARVELNVPIIKQAGTSGRDYMMPTTLSEPVSRALIDHILYIESIVGTPLPVTLPLFCLTTSNGRRKIIAERPISIETRIAATRPLIAEGLDAVDDDDLFTRRFKHTKLTHLAIRGAPVEVLARAGFQTSTISLRHYTTLSDEAFSDYEEKMESEHDFITDAFQGRIIDRDAATHPDSEHVIFEPGLSEGLGSCGDDPCDVFAPIGCYDCARFEAFRDGPHHIVLNFLQKRKTLAVNMGLPIASVNRDEHVISIVEGLIAKIKNENGPS
jgi:integrase